MSYTEVAQRTVTQASPKALIIDGKFTPPGRWADLNLDELHWNCSRPEWLDRAVSELRWARDSGEARTAIMLGDIALLQHPYALSLRDTINDLGADWEFDIYLNAFKVEKPQRYGDALRGICDTYEIATSPLFEDHIDGLDDAAGAVKVTADEAREAGYLVPDVYASGRSLKPHQVEAVLTLAANGGGLLADQVGLGKGGEFTCGLLTLNDHIVTHDGGKPNFPAVVAVTKSMKLEIAEEISRWMPDAIIEVLSGTKKNPIAADAQFIIVNHDLLKARLDDLLAVKPKAFIADEAHVYKNKEAERTKAALSLAKAVRKNTPRPYVVLATGTPFLNAPRELWSLLMILDWDDRFYKVALEHYRNANDGSVMMRTRLGRVTRRFGPDAGKSKIHWEDKPLWGQRAFEIQWCGGTYDKYGNWWNDVSTNASELNRMLLDAGMIRRRKSDVMHPLPPLTEALFRFSLDEDARACYDEIADEFRDWLIREVSAEARRDGRNPERAIEIATRKLMAGEDVMRLTKLRAQLALMKVPHTVEWVHRFMSGEMDLGPADDRRKLILYVHHQEARQALLDEPSFTRYNPVHILPDKDQNEQSIVDHKRRFQSDEDVRLIICSMAAREGHTLTAAKDVFLHEMPFVPSWIVQMAGRCWARLSEQYEPHEAHLHYAIAEDTIDTMLVRMNALKKSMFTAVIDGEGQDHSDNDLIFSAPKRNEGESFKEARARQGAELLEAFSIGARELGIAK